MDIILILFFLVYTKTGGVLETTRINLFFSTVNEPDHTHLNIVFLSALVWHKFQLLQLLFSSTSLICQHKLTSFSHVNNLVVRFSRVPSCQLATPLLPQFPHSYVFTFVHWQHFPCPHLIGTYNILSAQFSCSPIFFLRLCHSEFPRPIVPSKLPRNSAQKTTDQLTVTRAVSSAVCLLGDLFYVNVDMSNHSKWFRFRPDPETKGSTQR